MHQGLRFCGTTEWDCAKGQEDIEDTVVLGGWISLDPSCKAGIAGKTFNPEMFLDGYGKTMERANWFWEGIEVLGSFDCCIIHQFCQAICLSLVCLTREIHISEREGLAWRMPR